MNSEFDVDAFLAKPLTARVSTNGPTVRPTWFLWEEGAFWVIVGPWARLPSRVRTDPRIALVVDVCDLGSGAVKQVIARGRAELLAFDIPRARRKLARYLGPDQTRWDARFQRIVSRDPAETGCEWLRMIPDTLSAKDLSYVV